MLAMMILLSGCQGRAHRVLVVIRSAGVGRAAPPSGSNSVEDREAQRICRARKARSAGEIVCAGRLRTPGPRRSRAFARIHNGTRDAEGRTDPNGEVARLGAAFNGCCSSRPDVGVVSETVRGNAYRSGEE